MRGSVAAVERFHADVLDVAVVIDVAPEAEFGPRISTAAIAGAAIAGISIAGISIAAAISSTAISATAIAAAAIAAAPSKRAADTEYQRSPLDVADRGDSKIATIIAVATAAISAAILAGALGGSPGTLADGL